MHVTSGVRDPAAGFPLDTATDDAGERRQANRAVAVSAVGLALTGFVELAIALVSGSVALLGDALHNLSDVSTSALVFVVPWSIANTCPDAAIRASLSGATYPIVSPPRKHNRRARPAYALRREDARAVHSPVSEFRLT